MPHTRISSFRLRGCVLILHQGMTPLNKTAHSSVKLLHSAPHLTILFRLTHTQVQSTFAIVVDSRFKRVGAVRLYLCPYRTPWIEPRCTVVNMSGPLVALSQPCFGDVARRNLGPSKSQLRPMPPPYAIENVLSNLTAPGSWYVLVWLPQTTPCVVLDADSPKPTQLSCDWLPGNSFNVSKP